MRITKSQHNGQSIYVAIAEISERQIPKLAGFKWDIRNGQWWTRNASYAALLAEYGDESCKAELETISANAKAKQDIEQQIAEIGGRVRSRQQRLVTLPTGSVIACGIDGMISEDGTEIPPSRVASLYKLNADLPAEVDLASFLSTNGTLAAQCLSGDWQTAVTALTAEDKTEDAI